MREHGIILFLLTAFAATTLLGIAPMEHRSGHLYPNCLASALNPQTCPSENDPLAFLSFHFNAFRNFSVAPFFSSSLLPALAVLFALAASGVFASLFKDPERRIASFYRQFKALHESERVYSFSPFARWFALHEKRDPFLA